MRFEDAPQEAKDLLRNIRTEHFPELRNAKIKLIFDLKRRKAKGQICLARITKANDLIRLLTIDQVDPVEGYDYIISIDRTFWDAVEQADRVRVIRHELRHAYFDIDSDNDPYKIIDHDITDFHAEVDANREDPRWRERCGALVDGIYEQKRDDAREGRGKKRGHRRL